MGLISSKSTIEKPDEREQLYVVLYFSGGNRLLLLEELKLPDVPDNDTNVRFGETLVKFINLSHFNEACITYKQLNEIYNITKVIQYYPENSIEQERVLLRFTIECGIYDKLQANRFIVPKG